MGLLSCQMTPHINDNHHLLWRNWRGDTQKSGLKVTCDPQATEPDIMGLEIVAAFGGRDELSGLEEVKKWPEVAS